MIRTDLAMEAFAGAKLKDEGVKHSVKKYNDLIEIDTVEILSREASEKLGKKQGKYITVRAEYAVNRDQSHHLEVGRAFAGELKKLLPNKKELVLVVGLGNRKMTPDALGPKTADGIMVTRHLVEMIPGQLDSRVRPVCVFTPGVLGDTGMESAQSITAVAAEIKPSCIIVIDSLAAASADRISDTIQMCNCGIAPGAGIGNNRRELSQESIGVPVIAVGVPVVVYAQSIIRDAVLRLNDRSAEAKVCAGVSQKVNDLIVTPKEIDAIISDCSRILAKGINLALHDGVESEEIDDFMY